MSERLLVSTRKGLFFVERRAGAGIWSIDRSAFQAQPVSLTLADPRDGSLYVALRLGHFGAKLHRSRDGGQHFDELAVPAWPEGTPDETDGFGRPWPLRLDQIWSLAAGGAAEPGVIWCGTIPGGLFRSADHGASWQLVESLWNDPRRKAWLGGGYDTPGIHSICVHPADPQRILVGVSCGGVWLTQDGGRSWETRTQGMFAEYMPPAERERPEIQDPHRIAQCRQHPEALWVQHHNGAFHSTDGGAHWQTLAVPPSSFGFAVAAHPHDPRTAWFVPADKDERRIPVGGQVVVARTRDGGQHFEQLRDGLPQEHAYDLIYRHSLDVDASGERLALGSTTGALWVSEDGGEHFTLISAHLPPIYAVSFW